MKKKTSAKETLVFDFGYATVLILHVDHTGAAPRIRNFASVPSARAHTAEDRKQLFKEYVSSFDLGGHPEVIATWQEGIMFRQLILPDMPPEELKQAFWKEMQDKYSFNEEDRLLTSEYVTDADLEDGKPGKLFSAFYCNRRSASDKLALIEGLGFHLSALVPAEAALAGLVSAFDEEPDRDSLIFDIGYQTARLLIVRGGKNFFSRTVMLGGKVLTEAMVGSLEVSGQRLELDWDAAEGLKVAEGAQDPQSRHVDLIRPYLEKVVEEIKKSVDYYEGLKYARPVSRVIFTGGGSNLKGLKLFMEEALGLEVLLLDLQDYLTERIEDADKSFLLENPGSFACAFGASLAEVGGLNLIGKEVRHEKMEKVKRLSLHVVFSVVAVLLICAIFWVFFKVRTVEGRLAATEVEWNELKRSYSALAALQGEERFAREALKGQILAPALLKELSQITPTNIILEEIEFDRAKEILILQGFVTASAKGDVRLVTQFVKNLSRSPFFKTAKLVTTVEEDKRLAFKIHGFTASIV